MRIIYNCSSPEIICSECEKELDKYVLLQHQTLCEKCLIKAVLMVMPINFDKELILDHIDLDFFDSDRAPNGMTKDEYITNMNNFKSFIKTIFGK